MQTYSPCGRGWIAWHTPSGCRWWYTRLSTEDQFATSQPQGDDKPPRSVPTTPSGAHLCWTGGLRYHFHKMLTQTEQPHRTAKWPANSDTATIQRSSNGHSNQKVACNAALLDSWWNHSCLFWTNFPKLCKYVSESIRPNNIQSLEDSHQST